MKILRYICLVLSVCLMCGCTDDIAVGFSVEKEVSVSFDAVPVKSADTGTRAVTSDIDEGLESGYVVSDFWVFQYNQNGALIGRPTYYRTVEGEEISVSILLPSETDVEFTVVFLANTHDNSLDTKIEHSTLAELKTSGKTVALTSDLYQSGYDDILMNGSVTVTSVTTQIKCPLYRNIAKAVITLSNVAGSGITVQSVQLKNVSGRLYYADHLYDGESGVPNSSMASFVEFEKDVVSVSEGDVKSLTYYLTRNMRGISSSDTESGKNADAPAYSTYLEVMAIHNERNTPVRYRFYLGKNSVNNYDIEPNYLYNISLTFNNMGSGDDQRVEDLSVVMLSDANSYIIQPLRDVGIKYTVPVKARINKFWNSSEGKVAGDWEAHLLNGTNEWVAEVIWQDVAGKQVIRFCQEDGTLTDRYVGEVNEDSFSFVPTNDAVGTSCNVLIGVRNAKDDWDEIVDGYMWSWHIWLTDYDPDYSVGGWVDGRYSYQVPGGNLHKYSSFETIPMYDGKFIMDRNLGAGRVGSYENITKADIKSASGMYYAYGRKDPFPSVTVYDIKGVAKSFSNEKGTTDSYGIAVQPGPAAIHASVRKPYNYYWRDGDAGRGDWVVSNSLEAYDWNDLDKSAIKGEGKSFFDPCPPGWKLPHYGVFDSLGDETYVYASNCVSWTEIKNNDFAKYGGWLIYVSGKGGYDSRSGDITYYPAGNMRNYASGLAGTVGGIGGLWCADPGGENANYLYYANDISSGGLLFSHPREFYRYIGYPVRCIQE